MVSLSFFLLITSHNQFHSTAGAARLCWPEQMLSAAAATTSGGGSELEQNCLLFTSVTFTQTAMQRIRT